MLADADDGLTKIDTTFDGDTVWLSIDQMAELFQRDRSVIGKHVRNIFKEGELQKESVWAKFAYTAADGKVYDVDYYNLDVIISVGYRVKSKRGTQFRIWATGILAVLSSLLMAFAPGLFLICAAMVLNALSSTMFSGTDAALTYDSLKQAGQEERYLSVAANRSQIGMLASALGSLASTLRRFLRFSGCYLVSALFSSISTLAMLLLKEPVVTEAQAARSSHSLRELPGQFAQLVRDSAAALRGCPLAAKLIAADAVISVPCYLTKMFLQQRLVELGWPTEWRFFSVGVGGGAGVAGAEVGRPVPPPTQPGVLTGCGLLVGGGAGRGDDGGEVVIQTSEPGHPVIRQVAAGDFEGMARAQLAERKAFFYPPYARLTSLTLRHRDPSVLRNGVMDLAARLRTRFGRRLLGPMTPPVDRIREEYITEFLLKIESGASASRAREVLREVLRQTLGAKEFQTVTLSCDVDPQ